MNNALNYDKIFEEAKNGGRHAGTYNDAIRKTKAQLKKSIRSNKNNMAKHKNKINNPQKYDSDWKNKDDRQKQGLIKKWEKEIKIFREQTEIEKRILKERENNG